MQRVSAIAFAAFLACAAFAVRAQSVDWIPVPGATATDISIDARGRVWIVKGGDGRLATWKGGKWLDTQGQGSRIAANANGVAIANDVLAIDRGGQLIRYWGDWGANGTWAPIRTAGPYGLVDTKARAVSAGSKGQVWIISTSDYRLGDYQVRRWNGNGWDGMEQGGVRIAVDPDGSAWIVTGKNQLYRSDGNRCCFQEAYVQVKDIAVGADGTKFAIGLEDALWLRDPDWIRTRKWLRIPGNDAFQAVAVDPNGNPWAVRKDGTILRGVMKWPQSAVRDGEATIHKGEFLPANGYLLSGDRSSFGAVQPDGRFCIYAGDDPSKHERFFGCVPKEPQRQLGEFRMEIRDDGSVCMVRVASGQSTWCSPGGERGAGYYATLQRTQLRLYRDDPQSNFPKELLAMYNWDAMSRASQSSWITLTVRDPGPIGLVTSSEQPQSIACGAGATKCTAEYVRGSEVRLVAQGMAGGVFQEWWYSRFPGSTQPAKPDEPCIKQPATCVATLDQSRTISAQFLVPRAARLTVYPVSTLAAGSASATVRFGKTSEECALPAAGCTYGVFPGEKVEIVSTPKPGYTLQAGEGQCKGQAEKCAFDMPPQDAKAWVITKKVEKLPTLTIVLSEALTAMTMKVSARPVSIPRAGTPQPYQRVTCPEACKLVVGLHQEVLLQFEGPMSARGPLPKWGAACASENMEQQRQPPLPPGCRIYMNGDKTVEGLLR